MNNNKNDFAELLKIVKAKFLVNEENFSAKHIVLKYLIENGLSAEEPTADEVDKIVNALRTENPEISLSAEEPKLFESWVNPYNLGRIQETFKEYFTKETKLESILRRVIQVELFKCINRHSFQYLNKDLIKADGLKSITDNIILEIFFNKRTIVEALIYLERCKNPLYIDPSI
jgi:hypothetical protein